MNTEYYLSFKDTVNHEERINSLIFVVIALTPFIYINNPIDPIYFPKIVFISIMTSICGILWLLKIEKPSILRTKEEKTLLLYSGLIVLSTFYSSRVINSIFGQSSRFEGLLALIIYMIYFYITLNNFSFNLLYYKRFILIFSLISFYGICTYFGVFPSLRDVGVVYNKGRAISLFSNPNFFGTYLTLVLPLCVFSFVKDGKLIHLISSGVVYLALITTFTRSCWLGSLIGFVLLVFYFMKYNYSKKNLLIIMAIFLLITAAMDVQTGGRVISRFASIQKDAQKVITQAEDYENAGANRMFIWVRVIELIKEKPLLGYGLETMGDVFSERYMDDVVEMSGRKIIFDKAHNEYLHIAYSTGIPSLIVYLIFVSSVLIKAFKTVKNNHMAIPVLASVAGYLVQAFFNISVVSVAYIYWIFLGILHRISLYPDDVGLRIINSDVEI